MLFACILLIAPPPPFLSYFGSLDAVISPLSVTISINISKAAIKYHYKHRLWMDATYNNSAGKDNSHIFV